MSDCIKIVQNLGILIICSRETRFIATNLIIFDCAVTMKLPTMNYSLSLNESIFFSHMRKCDVLTIYQTSKH